MIKDLNYNIHFISCPTVRDDNGLALSSRNNYLSLSEQNHASIIYKSLRLLRQALKRKYKCRSIKKVFASMINKNHSIR